MGMNHRGLSGFHDSDTIEMEVSELGKLKFTCRDHLKRTWARETRLERTQKDLSGTSGNYLDDI